MTDNVKRYLDAVCKSQTSPMEIFMKQRDEPDYYTLVDVRMGPPALLQERIAGAKGMPLSDLAGDLAQLPKTGRIAVYTWGPECALAKHALLILGEAGYNAIEIGGGIAAWKNAGLPTETAGR